MQYVGIDIAWSAKHPSGVAVINSDGVVTRASSDVRTLDEIFKFTGLDEGGEAVVAVDAPLIVNNPAECRPVEQELTQVFWAYDVAPFPANLSCPLFQKQGHIQQLVRRLEDLGFAHLPDYRNERPARVMLEVFPGPSQVILFPCLNRSRHLHGRGLRYKHRKRRSWEEVHAEWEIYRARLRSLQYREPTITFSPEVWRAMNADITEHRWAAYKRFDDLLDGIFCAYLAYYMWTATTQRMRVFGDTRTGYIVLPRCLFKPCPLGSDVSTGEVDPREGL